MAKSKECSKCGTTKPLSDFYKDKQNKDGLKSACKKCYNLSVKQWRHNNIEKARGYFRRWARKPSSKLSNINRQRKYIAKPENRVKISARAYVRNRVAKGVIIKPKQCWLCRDEFPAAKLHAHHPNHAKPDVFIWVCPCCHSLIEHLFDDAGQKIVALCSERRNTPDTAAYP